MKQFLKLLLLNLVCTNICNAQITKYNFDSLGSTKYAAKIKLLEKSVVQKMYSDKSAQAWYSEFVTDRKNALLEEFRGDALLHDTLLLAKCNYIFKKLVKANPQYKFDTIQLYINRSITANACCYGEGTVMVNLGLFLWLDNDDELAFILAHEAAHQLLQHSAQQISTTIAKLTSAEFKDELKNIKKQDYGKYERFKNLMKDLNVSSGKHSRFKETEADSLASIFVKNANYNINDAAKVLLKLDFVDQIFTSDKLYSLQNFLNTSAVDMSFFKTKPKYNGLSGIKVTMNADKDVDSIKTHPECKKRYEAIMGKITQPTINCCKELNPNYVNLKEKATLEIARYLYENNALGYCAHLCFFALKNNYNTGYYSNLLSSCFSKMYDNDVKLKRFNSVNANAEIGSNLKELQDFLFNLSAKDLETLAAHFIKEGDTCCKDDCDFAKLMYQTQVKLKDKESSYNYFLTNNPNNKYSYFLKNPKK